MLSWKQVHLMTNKLRVLELFAGVGSPRMALRNLGIDHEVVAISEIDKFAIASYEAIHGKTDNLGDVSKIKVEDIPNHDLLTYGFPCFVAGTLIFTENGYKNIEDIQAGDMVLTHKNRFKKVITPMKQKANHTVEINTMGGQKLYTTEEHPFYVREKYYEVKDEIRYKNGQMKQLRKFKSPIWLEAGKIDKSVHYVGVSVNDRSVLPKWNGFESSAQWGHSKRYNTLNENKAFENPNFWWLVGRYIGDGWLRDYKYKGSNKHDERIIICCNKSETVEIESRLEKLTWLTYSLVEESSVYKYHIVNKELKRYLEQFGHLAHNKKLTNDIHNLPEDLLRDFISGYLSADGSLSNGLYKATSVSAELIHGMSRAINKAYHAPSSVYKTERPSTCVIEGRTVNQRDSYSLSFKKKVKKQDNAFYEEVYIWYPITGIQRDDEFNDYVYNMEVEEDNSYTANNIIVHNCQDLSISGHQRGMVKGVTRSGLLYECERIIESKKPKYLLMENVKNLVGKKFKPFFDEWLEYLSELGYTNYWKVLNSKDYGVPQNRERVFVVSILGEHEPYVFPEKQELTRRLKDVLEPVVDEKFYLSEERIGQLTFRNKPNETNVIADSDASTFKQNQRVYDIEKWSPTLAARDFKDPKRILEPQIEQVAQYDTATRTNSNRFRTYATNGLAPTISTMGGGGREPMVLLDEIELPAIGASRGRNPQNPSDRTAGAPTEQRLEINKNGVSNTLTTVQKDNYVVEPNLEFVGGIGSKDRVGDGKILSRNFAQGNRVYGVDGVSATLQSSPVGGAGGNSTLYAVEPMIIDDLYKNREPRFYSDTAPTLRSERHGLKVCQTESADVLEPQIITGSTQKNAFVGDGTYSPTLTTASNRASSSGQELINFRIRKLTPLECWRLMSFSDEDFYKAQTVCSNSQLYRQAGNSIVTSVLEGIFANLFEHKD